MKRIIIFTMLAGALFSSCNNNKKSDNPFSESLSGQQQANDVIGYYNNALEVYKVYNNSYISKGVDYLQSAQDYVAKKAAGGVAIRPIKPVYMIMIGNKENKEVPAGFGDKQETIKNAFDEMKKNVQTIRELVDATVAYLDAEDYKDDNGKKLDDNHKIASAQALAFKESAKTFLTR